MVIKSGLAKKYAAIGLVLFSSACATSRQNANADVVSPPSDRRGYSVNPGDFFGVYFKTGRPAAEDDLLSSLSEALGESKRALEHDLKLLAAYPDDKQLTVVGFTDSHECAGKDCIELSLRRARAVHDWLLSHGVSKSRLAAPYGFGSAGPIGDNETEDGRAQNRRAYISYEDVP